MTTFLSVSPLEYDGIWTFRHSLCGNWMLNLDFAIENRCVLKLDHPKRSSETHPIS